MIQNVSANEMYDEITDLQVERLILGKLIDMNRGKDDDKTADYIEKMAFCNVKLVKKLAHYRAIQGLMITSTTIGLGAPSMTAKRT